MQKFISFYRRFLLQFVVLVCYVGAGDIAYLDMAFLSAEEPYQRFLDKLRDKQLFELALVYLDDLQQKPNVSSDFKADLELERGLLLYQSAAVLPGSNSSRPQKLDNAEAAMRKFLETKKVHPRRGEARLKLGELLLTRAEEAKTKAGGDIQGARRKAEHQFDVQLQEDITEAIQFYAAAHQLFEATVQELAEVLEGMKGARIDASDSAKVAYRQKLRQELRQAQLLSAKSVEERGRSRGESNPQRKADLEQALKMFSELYSKEQDLVGIRNYSLFYRSAIQATLGKLDDAIDGYQRIADLEGVDILRPLQTNAVNSLVELLAWQGKYPLAIDRADKWLAALRPDERLLAETMALKMRLAKQKIAWANLLKDKNSDDRVAGRLVRDVRNELRSALRTPGPHLEQARELLGELGVESTERVSSELPKVKEFSEAFAAAQERIDRSETDLIGLESLRQELADSKTSEPRKAELTEQLAAAQGTIDVEQQQAIELLQAALRLYHSDDDREALYDARFRLAFLLLKQQRPWEAISLAEFLTRSAAGTEKGLRAAAITLGGFSDLLRSAASDTKSELTDQLQPFAQYLIKSWPQSVEASAAAAALVQLALINKDWDKAEEYLQLVPAGDPAAGKLRRDAGVSFYAKYLEEKKAAGEETEPIQRLRHKAVESLQLGVQDLTQDRLDGAAVEAINILARLRLLSGESDMAWQLLSDSPSSPLKALEDQADRLPAKMVMDTYRTAIQLVSLQLADGRLSADEAISQMKTYVERLQAAAGSDSQALAGVFVNLARDLKEQLAAAKSDLVRQKMSEALVIVASEAAKSPTFSTQYWAVDTIIAVAQELECLAASKAQVLRVYESAAQILHGILDKEDSQAGWIDPPGFIVQIRLKLAKTARGLGDYRAAVEHLATILEQNNGLLDVQMEAAKTYQAWGTAGNSGFHKVAIEGGRPDPKTRQKLIWGWGKIQQMTANQPNFVDQFFEARYQLAYSRFRYATGLQDTQQKSAELTRAENDIVSTAKLFPELGGSAMKKKFDSLLNAIRKSM